MLVYDFYRQFEMLLVDARDIIQETVPSQ
jgi:hypothetical protein